MDRHSLTSADGTRLSAYRWEPSAPARGDLVLVHGLGEHAGRYQHVADGLAGRGWRVHAVDLRGHGLSDGKRGHVDRWQEYLDDVRALLATLPGPYAMLAHSMGGLIALELSFDAHGLLALGASSPGVAPAVAIPAWKRVGARFLARLLPRLSMSNEIPATDICADQAVVERYLADPLVFSTVTPAWFREYTRAGERVMEGAARGQAPLYLFWGEDERIIHQPTLERLGRGWGGPTQVKTWPGLRHETLNEPVGAEVLAGFADWLDARLPAAS